MKIKFELMQVFKINKNAIVSIAKAVIIVMITIVTNKN